jgi:myosin heavy subunit
MVKKYDKNQCIATKNTLAKALYGRLFDYLIEKINDRLWINKKDDRSISILDIFGFEIFDKNSFEQLCINFTNERLQQLYTKYVFDNEISELKKDGLGDKVKDLTPPDNKPLIELIEKRMGISVFSLID